MRNGWKWVKLGPMVCGRLTPTEDRSRARGLDSRRLAILFGALVALALSAPALAAASSSPEIDAFQADVGDAADAGDTGMQPMPAAPLRRSPAGAARGLEPDASPTPSSDPEAARAPPRR